MNSATCTLSSCGFPCVVEWNSASIDSGEFIVIVAPVEMASHDGRPNWRSVASDSIFLNTDWIFGGAGTGPGRECAALMSCLRAGESFDMVGELVGTVMDDAQRFKARKKEVSETNWRNDKSPMFRFTAMYIKSFSYNGRTSIDESRESRMTPDERAGFRGASVHRSSAEAHSFSRASS
jgi:hypothetical protein